MNKDFTKPIFSLVTGILAILADILALISFATGLIKFDSATFLHNPALWIVLQFSLIIYGNLALAFSFVLIINRIYDNVLEYYESDLQNTLYLIVSLVWIPSYLIWLVTYYLAIKNTGLSVIIGIFSLFAFPYGVWLLSSWGALLARTLKPNLPIKIYIKIS